MVSVISVQYNSKRKEMIKSLTNFSIHDDVCYKCLGGNFKNKYEFTPRKHVEYGNYGTYLQLLFAIISFEQRLNMRDITNNSKYHKYSANITNNLNIASTNVASNVQIYRKYVANMTIIAQIQRIWHEISPQISAMLYRFHSWVTC